MNDLEYPPCPICKKKGKVSSFLENVTSWEYKGVYSLVKCCRCGLVFQSPREKKIEVAKYYQDNEYWGGIKKLKRRKLEKLRERKFGRIYKHVLNERKPLSLLDVGAGNGLFLSKFKDSKHKFVGIDISGVAVKMAKEVFGVNFEKEDILSFQSKKRFDYIFLLSVLEHVYNPVVNLQKAWNLLKKEGRLVLVIPNIDSLGYFLFRKDWLQFQPARHLYYFSPKTINKILRLSKFKIERIDYANWEDNYYSLFNSFRYKYSEKFKKEKQGGLLKKGMKENSKSFIFESKKLFVKLICIFLTFIEQIIKKSDAIIVYAKKTKN